jgi:uncharacterized protein (DUF983 family)
METVHWQPKRTTPAPGWPMPPLATAIMRGFAGKCPACGEGNLFNRFLKVVPACAHCGAPVGMARADDAPPYFTIVIVGHIVIPLMLVVEKAASPSLWLMTAIFVPLTAILTMALIQPVKGAVVGMMVRFNMLKPEIGT